MATQTGVITVNGIKIIECDTNPSTGLGLSAPIGSLASAKDGSGIFYKNSSSDTAWSLQINSSQSSFQKVYNYQNTDSSVTGSVNETVLANIKINGGDMGVNGVLDISTYFQKTGTAGNIVCRLYLSTVGTNNIGNTGVPSSSTLLVALTGAAATLTQGRLIRQLVNKNSQSLNKCFALISSNTEYGITSTVTNTVNINTASDFWVVATAQLGNSGDTGILSNIQTYISKP